MHETPLPRVSICPTMSRMTCSRSLFESACKPPFQQHSDAPPIQARLVGEQMDRSCNFPGDQGLPQCKQAGHVGFSIFLFSPTLIKDCSNADKTFPESAIKGEATRWQIPDGVLHAAFRATIAYGSSQAASRLSASAGRHATKMAATVAP